MLKLTSLFLFVVFFTATTMPAQTLEKLPPPQPSQIKQTGPDLRQVFSKESQKLKSESGKLDAKMMDKLRRQGPRNNWSTKTTILVTVLVVVLVGLAVVLAYNSKRCIRRSPSNCNFAEDPDCECLEYSQ
jgi:hypothetical protein